MEKTGIIPTDELIGHLHKCLKQPIALIGNVDYQKGYKKSISDLIDLIRLRWGNESNSVLSDGWIRCIQSLPPLRKRVIVTDGVISTIGWISDYRKGWEGWVILDEEYLNEIIAWREFPKP